MGDRGNSERSSALALQAVPVVPAANIRLQELPDLMLVDTYVVHHPALGTGHLTHRPRIVDSWHVVLLARETPSRTQQQAFPHVLHLEALAV